MEYFEDPGLRNGPIFPYWKDQPEDLEAFHEIQERACQKVKQVVDEEGDSVDLS